MLGVEWFLAGVLFGTTLALVDVAIENRKLIARIFRSK